MIASRPCLYLNSLCVIVGSIALFTVNVLVLYTLPTGLDEASVTFCVLGMICAFFGVSLGLFSLHGQCIKNRFILYLISFLSMMVVVFELSCVAYMCSKMSRHTNTHYTVILSLLIFLTVCQISAVCLSCSVARSLTLDKYFPLND